MIQCAHGCQGVNQFTILAEDNVVTPAVVDANGNIVTEQTETPKKLYKCGVCGKRFWQ